ncbi:MAG: hypothetical protein KDD14_20570 [Saprospiraceae bacterium]|nr:hypothetical protein [Saprospiraceae bacterium]
MYTSFIGKKFLATWNLREGKNLSAREFFDEVLFPLFFDDERHLMHVANSPFFQSVSAKDLLSGKREPEIRRENLHQSVATKKPNASFFVGFAAENTSATTSGQMTVMPGKPVNAPVLENPLSPERQTPTILAIDPEEIYASWIGEGLAAGVGGGFYLLIDQEDLLWGIFEGWKVYRKYLMQTPNLKGRQIETWNGQWLAHWLDGGDADTLKIEPVKKVEQKTKQEHWAVPTLEWTKLVLALCRRFPGKMMTIYAYNLSQTNTTLGFLNLNLPEVYRLYELRDKIFINQPDSVLNYQEIADLEPLFSFKPACKFGLIGLRAIEPKKLREYLPQNDPKRNKDLNLSKEEYHKQFLIFKLWICAMLNKTELLELAGQLADILVNFESSGGDRGTTKEDRLSDQVRSATNLRTFADKWGEVLAKMSGLNNFPENSAETIRNTIHQAVKMPGDHFPLFVALMRFEYNYLKNQARNK